MGWEQCLQWVLKRLGEMVEVIWWCEWTMQMLMFVRSSIASKSVFYLEWASTNFSCVAFPLRGLGEMQILFF